MGKLHAHEKRLAAFNGRNNPDNYIWGEIASQLGAEDAIKPYWANGPKAVDQRKWKEIIGDKPTLILLDELPPYLDNASTQVFGQGTLANMAVYSLSSLMSAALELPNCAIVVANLSGSYKAQTKALADAISNLQQETRRQAMTITPVQLAGNEIYEILKKRLIGLIFRRAVPLYISIRTVLHRIQDADNILRINMAAAGSLVARLCGELADKNCFFCRIKRQKTAFIFQEYSALLLHFTGKRMVRSFPV